MGPTTACNDSRRLSLHNRRFIAFGLLLFAGVIDITTYALAETPPIFRWATIVSGGRARLQSLAIDDAHNAYVLGDVVHTDTRGDGIPFTVRGSFLAKYDASGKFAWLMQATDDVINGSRIAATPSGHVYVVYEFAGFATVASKLYEHGPLLIAYDSMGRMNWIVPATHPEASQGIAMATDPGGNCFWAYSLKEAASRDKAAPPLLIEKVDPSGRLVWSRSLSRESVRMAVDGSGCLHIAGTFKGQLTWQTTSVATNASTPSDAGQIFLMKLNGAGKVLWVRQGECSGLSSVDGIAVDAGGNCTLLGMFTGKQGFDSITLDGGNIGAHRDFVVRYGPNGTVQWGQTLPDGTTDGRCTLGVDAGNNTYLARKCHSRSSGQGSSTDLQFSKLDPSGRMLWTRPGPTVGAFQFATDGSGYCFFAGGFASLTTEFDSKKLQNGGEPSRFPGIVLGMLETTSSPWQGYNQASSKPKGKPVFYIGSTEGFRAKPTPLQSNTSRAAATNAAPPKAH